MMSPSQLWHRHRRAIHRVVSVVAVLAVFIADLMTGTDLSLSLFYLFPVAYAAWFGGRGPGLAMAATAVAGRYFANLAPDTRHALPGWMVVWNVLVEAGINVIVATAASNLRSGFDRERTLRGQLESAWRRLDREQQAVGALQRELLPSCIPRLAGWSLAVHYATSTRAGGDYYDFFALEGSALGTMVADASGHGTPAAVVMAMLRALLHTAPEGLHDPSDILASLDRRMLGNLPSGLFATACWITLDPREGALSYALAGHCPPLVVRACGTVDALTAGAGLPLGVDASFPRATARAHLGPGDVLLVYTDGLTEAAGPDQALLGEERVREVLAAHAGSGPQALIDSLLEARRSHAAGAEQGDDITLIVVRRDAVR
jgi:sigma-B regulation protein RsbU (phosphoserine phosphatase)